MAFGFMQLAVQGKIGLESIVNVLYYKIQLGLESVPSQALQQELADTWATTHKADYVAALPAAYHLDQLVVRGWDDSGHLSEELPTTLAVSAAGGQVGSRDGNAHEAHLFFNMGVLHAFDGAASALHTSWIAVGPLLSAAVGDEGQFDPAALGAGVAAAFLSRMVATVEFVGANDALPIRVSFVKGGLATRDVQSWRDAVSGHWGAYTGLMRGRTNAK